MSGIDDKFKNLRPHDTIIGDPNDLVNLKVWTWSDENNNHLGNLKRTTLTF